MSAICHLVITCMEPAVVAIRLNSKDAREILCCQDHLDGLKKIEGVVIAQEREVGPVKVEGL